MKTKVQLNAGKVQGMAVNYTSTTVERPLVSTSESAKQGKVTWIDDQGGGVARKGDVKITVSGPS